MRDAMRNMKRCLKIGTVLMMALPVLAALLVVGQAAAQDLPAFPHAFFGRVWVTVNGNEEPAPVDVTIVAKVNGVECGSVKVKYPGRFGADDKGNFNDPGIERLSVQSNSSITIQNGDTIEFYVEGVKADQTYAFESGELTFIELTVAGPLPDPTSKNSEETSSDAGVNWVIVGGICGGALLIGAAGYFVLRRRRT